MVPELVLFKFSLELIFFLNIHTCKGRVVCLISHSFYLFIFFPKLLRLKKTLEVFLNICLSLGQNSFLHPLQVLYSDNRRFLNSNVFR